SSGFRNFRRNDFWSWVSTSPIILIISTGMGMYGLSGLIFFLNLYFVISLTLFLHGLIHDGENIDIHRAGARAAAAADAGNHAILPNMIRIFMTYFLAETLIDLRAGIVST